VYHNHHHHHPGLHVQDDSHAYIVQELCTGGTLRDLLSANGTCGEQEAAPIMRGVLDLLVECHRRHICYGDLKPANIMFSGSGSSQQQQRQVRAIDFGCSHSAKGRSLTQACGSPVYMAPEVALQRYTYSVDMWSAGVLVSVLLWLVYSSNSSAPPASVQVCLLVLQVCPAVAAIPPLPLELSHSFNMRAPLLLLPLLLLLVPCSCTRC
jgi:serine/threonine protein kinase